MSAPVRAPMLAPERGVLRKLLQRGRRELDVGRHGHERHLRPLPEELPEVAAELPVEVDAGHPGRLALVRGARRDEEGGDRKPLAPCHGELRAKGEPELRLEDPREERRSPGGEKRREKEQDGRAATDHGRGVGRGGGGGPASEPARCEAV